MVSSSSSRWHELVSSLGLRGKFEQGKLLNIPTDKVDGSEAEKRTKQKTKQRSEHKRERLIANRRQNTSPASLLLLCFLSFSSVNNAIKNHLKWCHRKTRITETQSKMHKQYPHILLCWLETDKLALHLNWHESGLPARETQIQIIAPLPVN